MAMLFPKPEPSVITRGRRRSQMKASLEEAYAEVDQRDGPYCRITGRYTQPGHVDARIRREHHHLVSRSLDRTRVDDARNIVVVCAEAHALFKAGWLVSEGEDARKEVRFHWTEHAPAVKPFRITAKAWMGE